MEPRPVSCPGADRSWLVPFATAPFPYDGVVPDKGVRFLDVRAGERRGHTSPRGGIYWEDATYSDDRVLVSVPPRYDPARPTIVLFLHGNRARLERDVCRRQGVPRQVAASGLNAILVAPQLAVDALDSSAGRFWTPGAARAFLAEAAARLAALGYPGLEAAPVVVVAYSGGYLPAVYALQVGGIADRVRALVLLDALFGEVDRYADVVRARIGGMAFASAYSGASRGTNDALRRQLAGENVPVADGPGLKAGVATFVSAPAGIGHDDFVTRAFAPDPLAFLLRQLAASGR